MTREKAKKILLELLGFYINNSKDSDISDKVSAVNIAIEALEEDEK